jgi:hypothetical protein
MWSTAGEGREERVSWRILRRARSVRKRESPAAGARDRSVVIVVIVVE